MTLTFSYSWILNFTWIGLFAAFWAEWFRRRSEARLRRLIGPEMQERLRKGPGAGFRFGQEFLLAAGLTLGVLSLAGPRWGVREAAVYRKGRDVAVVLDVSRSMLAEDVAPNRLRRA
ncbi:MAG: aerotolerance regulator BatB, partial [Kiritimatiellia bacterium]